MGYDRYLELTDLVGRLCRGHPPEDVFNAVMWPALHSLAQLAPADRSGAAQGLREAADAIDALENRTGEPAREAMQRILESMAGVGQAYRGDPGQRRHYPEGDPATAPAAVPVRTR